MCIAGPTASGKSEWAVKIAKQIGGEVINTDSMQVYSDLRIISARPTPEDMAEIPHHLFGHVDGAVRYSVGAWVREAVPVIIDVLARGRIPVLTGGTGLYFQALTAGLAETPDPGEEARAIAEGLLGEGIDQLRAEAQRLDPVAASRVLGNDPQRLSRIVAVAKGTGKPLSAWQANTRPVIPPGFWVGAILMPERQNLYDKINSRYEDMIQNGGIAEVQKLANRGISDDLPVMKAIGVKPIENYLEGKISLENAMELAKRDTRRFAKRQYTWFKGRSKEWNYITSDFEKIDFEGKISQLCR